MKSARRYSSPIRRQQADATRQSIVDAAFALLAGSSDGDLSHERVGRRARIATRTVYRHFPSRDDLLDAVWAELDRQLDLSAYPETEADLLAAAPRVFKRLEDQGAVICALLDSNAGRQMRGRNNERRRAAIQKALADATAHLRPQEASRVAGVFQVLFSAPAWRMLRDRAGLPGEDAAAAVQWAMKTLLDALRNEQRGSENHSHRKGTRP